MFSYWTDSTVLLTRDNFLHVYPWKDPTALNKHQQITDPAKEKGKSESLLPLDLSQPLYTVNLGNLKSFDLKLKELRIELVQNKPI